MRHDGRNVMVVIAGAQERDVAVGVRVFLPRPPQVLEELHLGQPFGQVKPVDAQGPGNVGEKVLEF